MATIQAVHDHPADRELLVTLLGSYGHRLLETIDGAEGLHMAWAERPDLIISDILMPSMDGSAFVRQLCADPTIAKTSIMFYTANYLERKALAMAQAWGVSQILSKPCEPADILRTVEAVQHLTAPATPPLQPNVSDRDDVPDPTDLAQNHERCSQQIAEIYVSRHQRTAPRISQKMPGTCVYMDGQMLEMDGLESTVAICACEQTTGAHLPSLALRAHALRSD
jgi:CheY-like chemotaxis protein